MENEIRERIEGKKSGRVEGIVVEKRIKIFNIRKEKLRWREVLIKNNVNGIEGRNKLVGGGENKIERNEGGRRMKKRKWIKIVGEICKKKINNI